MNLEEYEAVDRNLSDVIDNIKDMIADHNTQERSDDCVDEWDRHWYEKSRDLQAGYRRATQQRLDLARDFALMAMTRGGASKPTVELDEVTAKRECRWFDASIQSAEVGDRWGT